MSANSPPKPEDCNCFMVRSAARHVTQLYDQFLAPVGLHVTQFSILAKLKRLGPMTINALAKEMVMDRTTLGRNALPLERDGLIKIAASATDRRAKELHLTKAGEKHLLAGREAWTQAQARFETRVGAKRAADFRAMLRAVVASPHGGTQTALGARLSRSFDAGICRCVPRHHDRLRNRHAVGAAVAQ